MKDSILLYCGLILIVLFSLLAIGVATGHTAIVIKGQEKTEYDKFFTFDRRIVLYNGATKDFIIKIEGKCYVKKDRSGDEPEKYLVICRTGDNTLKQHSFGPSNTISYFEEELDPQPVNVYNYKITYNPESNPSNIDLNMEEK